MSLIFELVSSAQVHDVYQIEVQGYPEDEAATLETLQYRQSNAPHLFLGAFQTKDATRTLIGYICATASPSPTLTHNSMSIHIPGSPSVCIHSVCVSTAHLRQGVALALLTEYMRRLEAAQEYERALLIAHEELIPLYAKAGFELVGKSDVTHGPRPWFEMRRQIAPPSLPPGLWDALQRSSSSTSPPATVRLLNAFTHGAQDVRNEERALADGISTNKFDLTCPRAGCGSVILKSGVARWTERASVHMEPAGHRSPSNLLAELPAPSTTMDWWLVTPNAMMFENIGFSRAVEASEDGKKLKLLLCAECDLGPLGWCVEGGSEFWLACSRVGYRV